MQNEDQIFAPQPGDEPDSGDNEKQEQPEQTESEAGETESQEEKSKERKSTDADQVKSEYEEWVEREEEKNPLERELSPELKERVMEKVQDIFERGTAYTNVRRGENQELNNENFFENLFRYGVQSNTSDNSRSSTSREPAYNKTTYKNRLNKNKGQLRGGDKMLPGNKVWFNIVGRSVSAKKAYNEDHYSRGATVHVIFYPPTKEVEPPPAEPGRPGDKKLRQGEYYSFLPQVYKDIESAREIYPDITIDDSRWTELIKSRNFSALAIDEEGRTQSVSEYGFVLAHRIPPRKFEGVVLARGVGGDIWGEEIKRWGLEETVPSGTIYISKVVDAMWKTSKEKPEAVCPIYNGRGGLLWPVKMSYEKVQEYVKQREEEAEGEDEEGKNTEENEQEQ